MDLSNENFKSVQETPELILHTLDEQGTPIFSSGSVLPINNLPEPNYLVQELETDTESESESDPELESETDIDDFVLNESVDELKANIKHLKYKVYKLIKKNKEIMKDNVYLHLDLKKQECNINRLKLELGNIQNDNFTQENTQSSRIFLVVAGISLTTCIAVFFKMLPENIIKI